MKKMREKGRGRKREDTRERDERKTVKHLRSIS